MTRTNRTRIVAWASGLVVAGMAAWVATHTHWENIKVPGPLKGEALTNSFYAAQRFAGELGARVSSDRQFEAPPPDAVIVLGDWNWTLGSNRRDGLERWVESGGRLVVDSTLATGDDAFEHWSGIVYEQREDKRAPNANRGFDDDCLRFREERRGSAVSSDHWICDTDRSSFLKSARDAEWAMRGPTGVQAIRVSVGRGSVTAINASPFQRQRLFDGDHGWLFVAATGLRRGDEVHFLFEGEQRSLLSLVWLRGGPVVVLSLCTIALVLWRGGVRFGPLTTPQSAARRSLAEQILGTGRFALAHGDGEALLAATLRALDEAAVRRIPNYAALSTADHAGALSRLTGLDRHALGTALHHAGLRRSHELRTSIALLEAARRHTLRAHTRSTHGTP